jgi:hypothetical protein
MCPNSVRPLPKGKVDVSARRTSEVVYDMTRRNARTETVSMRWSAKSWQASASIRQRRSSADAVIRATAQIPPFPGTRDCVDSKILGLTGNSAMLFRAGPNLTFTCVASWQSHCRAPVLYLLRTEKRRAGSLADVAGRAELALEHRREETAATV